MTDLLRLPLDRIRTAAEAFQRVQKGAWLPARDNQGRYVATDGAHWKELRKGEWNETAAPSGSMEVPEDLASRVGSSLEDAPDPVGVDAVAGFAAQLGRLADGYRAGNASARETEWEAQRLVLVDQGGRVWTVGLRSGDWYAWMDGAWTKGDAPDPKTLLRSMEKRRGCHACGAPVEGDEDCTGCGTPAAPLLDDATESVAEALQAFQDRPEARLLPESVTEPWTLGPPDEPGGLPIPDA